MSSNGRPRPPPPPPPAPFVQPGPGGPNAPNLLEPMRRPGVGTRGQLVKGVEINTFTVDIVKEEKVWWKYEVVIATAARTRNDGTVVPPKPLPKSLLWKVWTELETNHAPSLGGTRPAFDGRSAIYTNRQLPLPLTISGISLSDRRSSTFAATFQKPIAIPLDSLRNYLTGSGGAHVGEVNDALQALNVLFRHGPSLVFPSTRTAFYPEDGPNVALSNGVQLWRGFFQSVRPCARGLQLNLDTTSGAYVRSGNLVGLVLDCANLRGDPRQLDIAQSRVTPATWIAVNRLLRKVHVTINRGQAIPRDRDQFVKMELRGDGIVSGSSANSYTFDVGGRRMNVSDFFLATYGTRLQFPNIPLVEIKRGVLVPLELVSIDPGNKWSQRLSPEQQNLASMFQILEPGARLGQILKMRRGILERRSQAYLRQFGVNLASETTRVDGRLLPPPAIEYLQQAGDRSSNRPPTFINAYPKDGGWKQNKRRKDVNEKLVSVPKEELKSVVVVLAKGNMESMAAPVLTRFFEWCAALGMNISRRLRERERGPLFLPKQQDDVARTITKALEHSETTFGTRAQIVFWLFDSENSLDYDKFKFETVRRGIASQALVHKKLKHKLEDFTFHLNCVLKVNAKLGGNNFRLPHAPQDPDRVFMNAQKPMLFGADLSHQPDKPSVAVVTASMHNQGIAHEETIRIQPLLEPSPTAPPNTRATRQEILVDLEEMVFFLLCRRTEASSACPPQAIVFFRDGVSESEISQVLSVEVAAIRGAFDRFKHILLDSTSDKHREIMQVVGESKTPGLIAGLEAWNPKLTFILTIKRHHLRAFVPSSRRNISPGTVIDTSVVDPRAFDFYLASHKGIKGTTRPTRYLVLTDDNTLSADAVQGFCNDAAHTLQRCNRAVSLPASVYYADIIGQRVRGWLNARNQYEASTDGPRGPPDAASRQEDLEACKLTLKETETGRNEFRAKLRAPAMWWL